MANLPNGSCMTPVSIMWDVWNQLGLYLNQKVLKLDKKRPSCGQFTNRRLRDSKLSWSGLSRLTDLDDPGSRLWWLISNGLFNSFLLIYINPRLNNHKESSLLNYIWFIQINRSGWSRNKFWWHISNQLINSFPLMYNKPMLQAYLSVFQAVVFLLWK